MSSKLFDTDKFAKVARRAVAEGVVLLENDGVLPLKAGENIALFGRSQFNYYKSGTGSGGMVNTKYVIGVREAFEADERFTLNEKLKATYEYGENILEADDGTTFVFLYRDSNYHCCVLSLRKHKVQHHFVKLRI